MAGFPSNNRGLNSACGTDRGAETVLFRADECLECVARICQEFRLEPLLPQVRATADMLGENGIVDVAVTGGFKAGKSSFLNTVIGRDVMPVAALPLTAIVTRVGYGPRDCAMVQQTDGSRQEIPMERLADYVTESGNPDNDRKVALVDVELAGLRPYRGVRFVDTPGLGSVYAHNTRTSMEWLPHIGAALLAVSIDHPLSEHDIRLLRELGRHTPEVSILLTKADLVSPDELAGVVAFVRDQVDKVAAGSFRLFPYSIRPGFEPLRAAVREYLLEHVAARHEEKSQEIIRYKLHALVGECRQYLGMALSAANAAQEARAELGRQLQQERKILSTVCNELWLLSNDLKSRLRDACLETFLKHHGQVATQLAGELRSEMRQWRGNLHATTDAFARWGREAVRNRLEPLSREDGTRLTQQQLSAAQDSFSRIVRAFQDRLAGSIRNALGINFSGAQFSAAVKQPSKPDVNLGRVFDTPFELLWFVIPMWLFRPLVRRHFLRLLPWEVEKNLYRLAGQWSDAIGRSVEDLARQAQEFIQKELDTIEALAASSQDQREAILRATALLDGMNDLVMYPTPNTKQGDKP